MQQKKAQRPVQRRRTQPRENTPKARQTGKGRRRDNRQQIKAQRQLRARRRDIVQRLRLSRESQDSGEIWKKGGIPMWGRMLVSVAVILLFMLVFFRVDRFEVSGNVRYTQEEVAAASGITEGDVLMGVNKTQTAGKILTGLPYVQQVRISKALPGTVRFEIVECGADVAVRSDSGRIWLMTSEGKLLERLDEEAETAYPVIEGTALLLPVPGDEAVFDDLARGEAAMDVLEAVWAAGLESGIQKIDVSDLTQITVTYLERLEVQLGSGTDLAYKLQYMKAAAAQLDASDSGVLDLSFAAGSQAVFHPIR